MLEFIKKARNAVKISPRYNMTLSEIHELCDSIILTGDISHGVLDAFIYGYYQGQRAQHGETKRSAKQ